MSYNENREETEKLKDAKDYSKRSASSIGTAKSSVNATFKKRRRGILLKSWKSILSFETEQRPSVLTERRKTMSGHIVFFVQLEVRAIRFDGYALSIESIVFDSIYIRLQRASRVATFWEIDDGSVCNSTSPWRRTSGSM